MSKWSRFFAKTQEVAGKAAKQAGVLAQEASHAMKVRAAQARIDEQYEKLGEMVYRELRGEVVPVEEKQAVVALLDRLTAELALLQTEDAAHGEEKSGAAEAFVTDGDTEG